MILMNKKPEQKEAQERHARKSMKEKGDKDRETEKKGERDKIKTKRNLNTVTHVNATQHQARCQRISARTQHSAVGPFWDTLGD